MDTHRHALTRDGVPVSLSPRYVRILAHLLSQPGKVISKNELLDTVWGDVYVTENTLEQAIGAIRKAIDDDAAGQRLIQTVTRKGYRFVGAVDASGAPPQRDAFDEWMKGRLTLESLDAEQLNDATAAFERVLAQDDKYAPAHTAVANACFLKYELTRPENTPNRALLECAMTHAQRACVLDPANGEAWATLGFVLTSAGEVERARAAARRGTALQPANWRHQFRLAVACWGQERLDAVDRTLTLMPDFAPARLVAAMVYVARQAFPVAEQLAVEGAARQSQDAGRDVPFPAFGLHWLLGLLLLRNGDVAKALESFEREVNEGRRTSIYYREYRVNALIGAGYAHLAANDPAAAADAFGRALEILPANGRALLGLHRSFVSSGRAAAAESSGPRVSNSLVELAKGSRGVEAAVLNAGMEAAHGNPKRASAILERLLEHAPPGHTGWMIPIDPALGPLRDDPCFGLVLALLSARAS